MNAYELANELENYVWMNPNNNRDYCKEVKDILRQQADRIAELEKQSKFQGDNKVNAEPVAWWCAKEYADSDMEGGHVEELEFNQPSIHDSEGLIWEKPLYTHPAKTLNNQKMIDVLMELAKYRLLTADEIEELAILRKAQEK